MIRRLYRLKKEQKKSTEYATPNSNNQREINPEQNPNKLCLETEENYEVPDEINYVNPEEGSQKKRSPLDCPLDTVQVVETQMEEESLKNKRDHVSTQSTETSPTSLEEHNKQIVDQLKKIDASNFYWKKFGVVVAVVVLSIALAVIKNEAKVKRCTGFDWGLLAGYVFLLLIMPAYCYMVIRSEQIQKKEVKYNLDPKEVHFESKLYIATNAYSGLSGLISTITGIGGGVLLTPWLTYLKVFPVTASWTLNYLVLISKIAAVIVAMIGGQVLYAYVFFYGCLIAAMVVVVENTVLIVIKKMKSQIILPVGMFLVLLTSLILNLYLGIDDIIEKANEGKSAWQFSSYC